MEWSRIRSRIMQRTDVPIMGYILAYTRKKVIFRKYSSLEELDAIFQKTAHRENQGNDKLLSQEILEIHLFDHEKEYRAIASESKRSFLEKEISAIEHIADFSVEDEKTVYKEKIMLEPAFVVPANGIAGEYITVYNHIFYEHGMAKVDDYRLVMEG